MKPTAEEQERKIAESAQREVDACLADGRMEPVTPETLARIARPIRAVR
jgi:hypothetical protein